MNARDRYLSDIAEEVDQEMRYWWLSFCDSTKPAGEQFLGVSIVRAPGPATALQESHQRGCNPGGEVSIEGLPRDVSEPPENWLNRLVTDKDEVKRLGEIWFTN